MRDKMTYLFLILAAVISITGKTNSQWAIVYSGTSMYSLTASGSNLYAGGYQTIIKSTNNGLYWNVVSNQAANIHRVAASDNYVYDGTSSPFIFGLFRSTNYGANWVNSIPSQNFDAIAASGNFVFAGSTNISRSTDYGMTWNTISLANSGEFRSFCINGNNVFAGTSFRLYYSNNNGTNWSQSSLNNQYVYAITANSNYVYAGTSNNGVYLSSDAGLSWSPTSLNFLTIFSLANTGSTVIAGTASNGVLVSTNNGTSWSARNENLPPTQINAVLIINNYILVAANSGIYRRPLSEITGIKSFSSEIPAEFNLEQNYPNPFNPITNVKFQIPNEAFVKLIVFDILGREVTTLVNARLKAGTYKADWDASAYPSGVYFYRLTTENYSQTKRMVLVK